jgi:hypothetical protein
VIELYGLPKLPRGGEEWEEKKTRHGIIIHQRCGARVLISKIGQVKRWITVRQFAKRVTGSYLR